MIRSRGLTGIKPKQFSIGSFFPAPHKNFWRGA
jgi:hypothetical protein